jgi:hypothetical protein
MWHVLRNLISMSGWSSLLEHRARARLASSAAAAADTATRTPAAAVPPSSPAGEPPCPMSAQALTSGFSSGFSSWLTPSSAGMSDVSSGSKSPTPSSCPSPGTVVGFQRCHSEENLLLGGARRAAPRRQKSLLTLQLTSSPSASSPSPFSSDSCSDIGSCSDNAASGSLASEADLCLAALRSQLRPLNLRRTTSGPLPIPDST